MGICVTVAHYWVQIHTMIILNCFVMPTLLLLKWNFLKMSITALCASARSKTICYLAQICAAKALFVFIMLSLLLFRCIFGRKKPMLTMFSLTKHYTFRMLHSSCDQVIVDLFCNTKPLLLFQGNLCFMRKSTQCITLLLNALHVATPVCTENKQKMIQKKKVKSKTKKVHV